MLLFVPAIKPKITLNVGLGRCGGPAVIWEQSKPLVVEREQLLNGNIYLKSVVLEYKVFMREVLLV